MGGESFINGYRPEVRVGWCGIIHMEEDYIIEEVDEIVWVGWIVIADELRDVPVVMQEYFVVSVQSRQCSSMVAFTFLLYATPK